MLKTGEMKMRRPGRGGVLHVALRGPLHDDGHGVDDGVDGRGARASGLPTNAAIPAVDSRRTVLARMAGRRIVDMVHEDLEMSQILTARRVRERDHGQWRDRRLDQRGRASARRSPGASASS